MKKQANLDKDKPTAKVPVVTKNAFSSAKKKANSVVQKIIKVQSNPLQIKKAVVKNLPQQKPQIMVPKPSLKKQTQKNPIVLKQKQMMNPKNKKQTKSSIFNQHDFRLLKPKDQNKQIAAIIVTFCSGQSFDQLFTSVQQKTLEGTQVLVYSCHSKCVKFILAAFEQKPQSQSLRQFMINLKSVDPDCVVFNWQCCSSYQKKHFLEGRQYLFKFLGKILEIGYMAMFSDFSLKALINQWDTNILGKNPFVNTGQNSNPVALHFKSSILKECPSAQLQLVGQMAEGGECHIECMAATIVYSVNQKNIDEQRYSLQVLTINKSNVPKNPELILKIDQQKGSAGHVLLRYKNGGCLLTSMGHWFQLMKIDTSQKKIFEIAEQEYGTQYAMQMKKQYEELDEGGGGGGGEKKKAYLKNKAVTFVQNQAPCSNMNKKKKKG